MQSNRPISWIIAVCCAVLCAATPTRAADTTPPAQRIISLKPNITELLFALGAGKRVVGVTRWCNYPAAARRLPKVADYIAPNLEAVFALKPDLVIAAKENSIAQPIEQLQARGIPVLLVNFSTLNETWEAIRTIGARIGAKVEARQLLAALYASVARIADGATGERPRVLFLTSRTPLIAAGPSSLLGELLVLAGGTNVVSATAPAYPQISLERVIAEKPQIVIDVSDSMESQGATRTAAVHDAAPLPALPRIRVRAVDIDRLRAGPRLGEGLEALREAMQ